MSSQLSGRILDELQEEFFEHKRTKEVLDASKVIVKDQMIQLGESKIEHDRIKISISESQRKGLKKGKDGDLMAVIVAAGAQDVYDHVPEPNIDRIEAAIAAGRLPADMLKKFFNIANVKTMRITGK